jgi:hypothetical protein
MIRPRKTSKPKYPTKELMAGEVMMEVGIGYGPFIARALSGLRKI